MYLTKEAILSADDLPTEDFPAPEWGGTLRIKALSGAQREAIELRCADARAKSSPVGLKGLKGLVATYAIVGEDGQPLFTEKDVAALQQKSAAVLDRLFEHVIRANALSKQDVEELAGN